MADAVAVEALSALRAAVLGLLRLAVPAALVGLALASVTVDSALLSLRL